MKYSTRMVLIPETEYLKLKESSSKSNCKTKMKQDSASRANELIQKLGKQIRQRDQKVSKIIKPSIKIVEHLPPIYQAKAKLLLSELDDAGITYNNKRELVINNGEIISRSNIIDLIKESLVKSNRGEPPAGWQLFMDQVVDSAVPATLFKAHTRQEIERARAVPEYEAY